jgi:hypothetical protein
MSARLSVAQRREQRWWKAPATQMLNARLNASEKMLRGRIGDQKVDDLIDRFMATGKADPRLFTALYKKRDPYRWLAQYWAPKQRAKEIH